MQFSVAVGNGRLDSIENTIGTAPILKMFSGTMPANSGAADSGTVLATINLPSDWMQAAVSRTKTMSGTWEDTSADADGTAAFFRIYASDGVTCHIQGTVSLTGGGGAMTVDNVIFKAGQDFKITAFAITDGNQ
jgi:hypothetical protein